MGAPVVPSRDPASLGTAITNVRTPVANELSAANLEAMKDAVIAHGPLPIRGTVSTTDATHKEVLRFTPKDNTLYKMKVVAAIYDSTGGNYKTGHGYFSGGMVAQVPNVGAIYGTGADWATEAVEIVVSGSDLVVKVIGIAATNISWSVVLYFEAVLAL